MTTEDKQDPISLMDRVAQKKAEKLVVTVPLDYMRLCHRPSALALHLRNIRSAKITSRN